MSKEQLALNHIAIAIEWAEKFSGIRLACGEHVEVLQDMLDREDIVLARPITNKSNGRITCSRCKQRIRNRRPTEVNVSAYCDKCGVKLEWSAREN